jgi:hypothetical protein
MSVTKSEEYVKFSASSLLHHDIISRKEICRFVGFSWTVAMDLYAWYYFDQSSDGGSIGPPYKASCFFFNSEATVWDYCLTDYFSC